jgi:glycosyltransferase involved in cell wall biosynthesis
MNTKLKKVTALIPCYNEEEGIGAVIRGFPIKRMRMYGYKLNIVIIDNNSTDRTAEIARLFGATVLFEPNKGKGNAMRRGFSYVSRTKPDYVVMLDGDNTYRSQEILRLIEPLDSGFCNVVIGSRLGGRISEGSMESLNRMGNWIFSHLVRYVYRANVTDVLTGYFAWTLNALEQLRPHLKSNGFAIEMEMVTKMARLGEEISCVPISYDVRDGEASLHPFYDGMRILRMFAKNLFWNPAQPKIQRVAFVSDAVMPYNQGGKERRLYEISKRLVCEGREVHIYTMKWWNGTKDIVHDGVHFHAISKLYPLYSGDRRSIYQAIMFGLATLKLLFAKFDVLDVDHMPFFPVFSARIVTWLKRKKLHATWHEVWGRNYWLGYLKGPAGILGYLIERLSFMMPDVIISNSNHTTARLRLAGFKKEIKTVTLGVDLKSINTAKTANHKSDVIFVGRLLSHKNVGLLIKAIGIVRYSFPDILCKIVGDGPERKNIEMLIHRFRLEKNIHMLNLVNDHQGLYGLMKASKMLVLPSTREGFGLVAIEANAAGIPVITTSHEDNAAKDLIHEGHNGFLVEPNARNIADKIMYIMKNPKKMRSMENIEQYDWHFVAEQARRVFE